MKKFFSILFILFLAAFGITWTITARNVKQETMTWIAKINQHDDVKLSYNKLSSTGFPFAIGVTIEGAQIKLNPSLKNPGVYQDTISFIGPVKLSSNILADDYQLSFADYTWKHNSPNSTDEWKQQGKTDIELQFDQSYISSLLQAKHFEHVINLDNCKHIKSFKVSGSASVWSNLKTNDELFKLDASHIYVSRKNLRKGQDTYNIDFAINNAFFTDTFQKTWMDDWEKSLLTKYQVEDLAHIEKPISFRSKLTAHTIGVERIVAEVKKEIAGSNIPEQFQKEIESTPLGLTISSIDFESEFYTAHYSGHFFYPNLYQNPEHTKFVFQQKTIIGEKLQRLLEIGACSYFGISNEDAKQLLPQLSSFGTIYHSVESDAKSNKQMIQEYHFATDDYQVNVKVDLSQHDKLALSVQLINFDQLFDEALNYATRAYDILDKNESKIHIGIPKVALSKDFATQAKAFLRKISDHPNSHSSNLEISITGSDFNNAFDKVGTLTAQQAQTEWQKISSMVQITPRTSTITASGEDAFVVGAKFQLKAASAHDSKEDRLNRLADAVNVYLAAASKNNAKAINNIATIYLQAPITIKNKDEAKKLFQKAASLGDKTAAMNLDIIEHQKGIPALIIHTDKDDVIVACKTYTKESIKNLLRTSKKLGWTNIKLLPLGQPYAIPKNLRAYTKKIAPSFGLKVVS